MSKLRVSEAVQPLPLYGFMPSNGTLLRFTFLPYSFVVTICTIQWSLYVPPSGHYMYRPVFTICTAQWSVYVPSSVHNMYHQWSLYVPSSFHYMYGQWSLHVPPSGQYMYRQFNVHQFYVLPTQCVVTFCY